MKRPQRNLLLFVFILCIPLIADKLGVQKYALVFSSSMVILILVIGLLGKDYFIARYKTKQRDWEGAINRYQKFETFLTRLRIGNFYIPVCYSLYTYNGFALVKNNIAHILMNTQELQGAKQLLLEALELDKLYALPHVNLAVIAAIEGNADEALREADLAKQLGFRGKGLQPLIRKILATTNETVGKVLS